MIHSPQLGRLNIHRYAQAFPFRGEYSFSIDFRTIRIFSDAADDLIPQLREGSRTCIEMLLDLLDRIVCTLTCSLWMTLTLNCCHHICTQDTAQARPVGA